MGLMQGVRRSAQHTRRGVANAAAQLVEALTTESRLRSAVKALTWRGMAALVTLSLVFAVGGSTQVAVGVASIDSLIKIVLYYAHERAWCMAQRTPDRATHQATSRDGTAATQITAAHVASIERHAA